MVAEHTITLAEQTTANQIHLTANQAYITASQIHTDTIQDVRDDLLITRKMISRTADFLSAMQTGNEDVVDEIEALCVLEKRLFQVDERLLKLTQSLYRASAA